jgi:hypothetical protein
MLWAIVSSVFVIYLYRKLNATAGADAVGVAAPNSIDTELAKLNGRIDALENMVSRKTRRIAP